MAQLDVVIRGGTVVDGTGVPRYQADVGIKNGRVARMSGRIQGGGAREIDACGCIVAPGAIDLHTHYDAQLNWDPYATLSGWFGVTSVSIGQCGFGFAPTRPEDRDLNMRMMNRIEAIPLRSMQLGMRWDWVTFPEYLDSLDRQGLGVNVGALVPFSPLRGYVLGMRAARERTSVTEAELNEMKRLLHEAMKAGAFGFSADKNLEDRTEDGSALPSHVASPGRVSGTRGRPLGVRRRPSRLDHRDLHHGAGAAAPPDGDDAAEWPAAARRRGRRRARLRLGQGGPRGRAPRGRSAKFHGPRGRVHPGRIQHVRLHAPLDSAAGRDSRRARGQAPRPRGPGRR